MGAALPLTLAACASTSPPPSLPPIQPVPITNPATIECMKASGTGPVVMDTALFVTEGAHLLGDQPPRPMMDTDQPPRPMRDGDQPPRPIKQTQPGVSPGSL